MKTFHKLGTMAINISLTGWPGATVCIVGVVAISAGAVLLGSKLIKNGYQLVTAKGFSLRKSEEKRDTEDPKSDRQSKPEEKKKRSGSDLREPLITSASFFQSDTQRVGVIVFIVFIVHIVHKDQGGS